jgi:hypothetical protein
MPKQPKQSLHLVSQANKAKMQSQTFLPLDQESRTHVETACAAFHLTRAGQTLRSWACLENGPIRPIRINRRLAWSVADIKRLLAGEAI